MSIFTLFEQHDHIFITGTDTEVGKTYCSVQIIKEMSKKGVNIFPFKPISAGTVDVDVDLGLVGSRSKVNEDALALYQASQGKYSIDSINPIVFDLPIAPHLAAKRHNQALTEVRVDKVWSRAIQYSAPSTNKILVEGAGGWHLPLNDDELLSDWVASRAMPVVLVVGVRLGCLNHALLTAEAIKSSGCKLVGWVANFIEAETEVGRENVDYLAHQFKKRYEIDCIMEVPRT